MGGATGKWIGRNSFFQRFQVYTAALASLKFFFHRPCKSPRGCWSRGQKLRKQISKKQIQTMELYIDCWLEELLKRDVLDNPGSHIMEND